MLIGKFRHRGLKALYHDDDASGVSASSVAKVKRILAALEFADDVSQLTTPGWKVHPLKGSRSGIYSVTVTANWRLTFRLEENTVTDIDFEDYH
jgi:toxin HigB-1